MNYSIILPDEDRQAIAAALGKLVQALTNAAPVLDRHIESTARLLNAQASTASPIHLGQIIDKASASPPSLPSPADPPRASQNPSPEARDRWATDKAGNPWKLDSRGVSAIDVHVWKTEQFAMYLKVTYQSPSGTGHADANCFAVELWPCLIKAKSAIGGTRLYVTRKGNYTNIVGVRA